MTLKLSLPLCLFVGKGKSGMSPLLLLKFVPKNLIVSAHHSP